MPTTEHKLTAMHEGRRTKVVCAIDSFKGCLTSAEANRAAAEGVRLAMPDAEVVEVSVSDGGEGFLDAFHAAIGGRIVKTVVRDPLKRPVVARYLLTGDKTLPNSSAVVSATAVIEMAQASGLMLLDSSERNPLLTTTYGVGQLLTDAMARGARHIIVGLGGSATSDAGMGMLDALREAFGIHGIWQDIATLNQTRFTIATDVTNPLCGDNGAARVFAPQKGATQEMVTLLEERARAFADVSAAHFGYDFSQTPGAGAAGGLGYAFMQYLHADCRPGVQLLLDAVCFRELAQDADIIITGEGAADRQTLMGKLPMGILDNANASPSSKGDSHTCPPHAADVPVCLIAGRVSDRDALLSAGFTQVLCINPPDTPTEIAMRKDVALSNITRTIRALLSDSHWTSPDHIT